MRIRVKLTSALCFLFTSSLVLARIEIKHHKFWDTTTNEEFLIKGIAYQPRERDIIIDPISDARESYWRKDLQYMKDLNVNTIRVYEVDADLTHGKFMSALKDANMNLILDLGQGKDSINRAFPSYNQNLLDRYKKSIDTFSQYDNIIGFFAGNEVGNAVNTTASYPYLKALVRDLKAYSKTKPHYIPIGYSSNDDAEIRLNVRDYLYCGDEVTRIDFLGLNLYSWCGNSSYEISGYKTRTEEYKYSDIPVFLSETGCNVVSPRSFNEVSTVLKKPMSDVFSGLVMYEYSDEKNNYGVVQIKNGNIAKLPDYYNLQKQFANVQMQKDTLQALKERLKYSPTCPAVSDTWSAVSVLPPTPNNCICSKMVSSLSCVSILSPTSSSTVISKNIDAACGLLSTYDGSSSCAEISQGDGSIGNWGQFAQCSFNQQLSFAYNKYFVRMNGPNSVNACDFKGTARRVNPKNILAAVKECGSGSSGSTGSGSTSGGTRLDILVWLSCGMVGLFMVF